MLTVRSPSAITTRLICIECGGQMSLTIVEPSYTGKPVDNHTFRCMVCQQSESYVFERG